MGVFSSMACQHRSGNDAGIFRLQLSVNQLRQAGAETSANQPRICNGRTSEGDDPFGEDSAGQEKMSDCDHVLITDMPDHALMVDLLEKMDMCAHQTGRMAAGKFTDGDPLRCGD